MRTKSKSSFSKSPLKTLPFWAELCQKFGQLKEEDPIYQKRIYIYKKLEIKFFFKRYPKTLDEALRVEVWFENGNLDTNHLRIYKSGNFEEYTFNLPYPWESQEDIKYLQNKINLKEKLKKLS